MAVNQPSKNAARDAGADPGMVHAFNQGMDPEGQQQEQAPGASASRTRGQSGQFSFTSANDYVPSVISRHKGGEALGKITEMLRSEFKERDPDHELELIPINWKDTVDLYFSAVVVTLRHKAWLDRGVAYYTLIIEGSAPALESVSRFVANETITELRLTGDTNNQILNNEVRNRLEKVYPMVPQWGAGVCVVPRDFNPANEELAHKLAVCAGNACSSELSRNKPGGWHDLNLADAVGNEVLTVRPKFGNEQIYNAVGHPVRADVEIRTTVPGQLVQGQQDAAVRDTTVTLVRGFVDLVWAPVDQQNQPYAQWVAPQQLQPGGVHPSQYQKYLPRFVATQSESEKVPTLGGQLLSLVSAACLSTNMLWAEAFRPAKERSGGSDVDWKNIGALNIEANFENSATGYGVPLDSTLDSFTRQNPQNGSEFHKLIASTIRQRLAVSVDIPECGPETALSEAILLAGDSDAENRRTGNRMLVGSSMDLTNGLFVKNYMALVDTLARQQHPDALSRQRLQLEDHRLVTDEYNRIHLGYFIYRTGEKLDIRFIDYLALLATQGTSNHQDVLEWSDTFSDVNLPLNLRISRRQKIIEGIVGERNVTYTGFARRCTLDNIFFTALLMSIAELKIKMNVDSVAGHQPQYRRPINPFVADAALDPGINLGLFGSSYAGPSQQYGNRAGFNRFMY
ncbi:hypothetical protein HDG34_003283 [Paraburkholderia sp. HC6.4b]|uniref:hypothetical protein n=1 Tax=unclassified Paraburkholderia TaxID=2615204 RepID=UPI0016209B09|nr:MULTISPECIES: hypothetical protein [unclassified Paraburkholderia]MBB5409342.1 hypothetical protein [Paraburkholderia sp. HC6.4b]MBB5451070.1 hypothetical protein [Paraburkholderia sp. Kb1A]